MTGLPDNVSLEWIGQTLLDLRADVRRLGDDLDMLVMRTIRIDRNVAELRDEIRALWAGQSGLRRRIETLEGA